VAIPFSREALMTTADIPSRRAISSWVDLLRSRAGEHPERPAFTFLRDGEEEGARLTYAELDAAARALAVRLRESGAVQGDRALLLYPPGLDFVVAFFGCLLAGVVAVPAYPPQVSGRRRGDPRLRAIAADCRPRFALTTGTILARREAVASDVPELAAAVWLATDGPSPEAADWIEPEPAPDSLAFLQYTSGSTSTPKGVMVTHGNLLHNEEMIRRACGHTESSVLVGWLPLYHDMGLIANVLQPLYVGARSVLMSPAAFLQRPVRWLRAISRYGGTTSGGPNFAWDLCVRKIGEEERAGLDLSSWKVAFNGAEPVRAETLERFAEAFASCGFRREAVYPCYGLAEATLFVTGREALRGPAVEISAETGRPRVGCGHAWLEQRIAIVDPESGSELPPGGIGEVWISGPSVAAGYWGRPEETVRDFGAQLAGREAEGPFLRTGDLGFLVEGELYVTGRLKDLVILRGRNHYPQDLEATAEGAHPDLQPAGSAAFAAEGEGEERLVIVAEVQRRREAAADVEGIADAVRRAVAEGHEARVHEVVLIRAGTLPRTSSGKVRRRATREAWEAPTLEALGASRAPEETAGVGELPLSREALAALPAGERGPALVTALRERVGRVARISPSRLDADRPLTALGLDSLMAIELENELEEALGTHLPLTRLLDGATLADLAGDLLVALEAPAGEEPVTPAAAEADHPLSYGQRALWFLEKLHPETVAFLLVGAARVHGDLDAAALRRALERVVARHPALRTTFREVQGEPRQRVEGAVGVEFVEGAGGSEAEGLAWLEREAYRPFDLAGGPLLRVGLWKRPLTPWPPLPSPPALPGEGEPDRSEAGEGTVGFRDLSPLSRSGGRGWERGLGGEGLFFLTIHHLISDFWSLGLLLTELEALYREETGGAPADLAPVTLSFPDFVHWQERRLAGPRGEELWRYWSARLAEAPMALDLPTDRPRPAVQTSRGAAEALALPAELVTELEGLGRAGGATLYMGLLAGFEVLLGRWTGQGDLLLGSPTTGRGPAELAGVMGYFINPLVHRADLSGEPAFVEHLARVRASTLEAFAHQDYPFPLLAERLQPERDPSRSPVFQVFFVLEQARLLHERGLSAFALGEEGARMELLGATFESLRLPRRSSQFDLMLLLARLDGGMALTLEYNPDLFDAATIRRFLGHYRVLLAGAVDEPQRPIGLLPLLTPAEEAELVTGWNAQGPAVAPIPEDAALHRLFEAWAAFAPWAVAVVHEVEALTYGELDARANRLARRLRALGVGPEVPVGLSVERSLDLIVGMLGILKAGGAYVPVDPSSPEERRAWILEDAFRGLERPVVVTANVVNDPSLAFESPDPLPPASGGDHLAYVIYTSGSTGRPKGVAVTHFNAVRLLAATEPWFGFGPEDVWTLFHSFAFDFSVWEIWGALAHGGRLVIVPRAAMLSPQEFHELLATEGVTVLNQTPSAFRQLSRVEERDLPALRLVIFGGEALEPASLKPWARLQGLDRPRLVNMYGITETTVHVTYRPLTGRDLDGPGFLGVPIPDLQVYLLDRRFQPVPEGVPGEIFVGGAGVARGYLGRPDLTAERFVPDPFSSQPGVRLYRSGDLARFRRGPAGLDLEYLGRADHQVKIRGFRIELGEIEAALLAHSEVRECVVLAQREGMETRLTAWIVQHPKSDLRAWLADRLPDYMIPSAFVALEALPLTPHGKVDRAALLRLDPGAAASPGSTRVAPRTATEAALAHIWREVLGVDEVGVDDDFFAVGGHSLKATELVAGVARRLGVELPLHTLFSAPTVAGLARAVEALRGTSANSVAVLPAWKAAPEARFEPFPLTEIQQAYWIGRSGVFELGTVSTQSYLEIEAAEMDLTGLEWAWQRLIDRHDMLRAVVGRDGLQRVLPEVPPYRFEVLDLRGRPEAEAEAELLAVRSRMGHQVLPADRWPLFEIRATQLDGRVRLHARLDALIYDASSAHVLLEEWMALAADPAAELPPFDATFRDYVLTARELTGSPARARDREYWRERAVTLPPAPDLPLARDPAALSEHRFVRRSFRLPAAVWGRLKERAARVGVGPSALLATVWAEALAPWSRSPRFTLNLTLFQRLPLHPEVGRIVGDFTSLTLLEIDTGGAGGFAARARRVQEQLWRDLDHRLESGLETLREMGRRRGGVPVGMPVVFTSMLGLDVEMVSDRLPGRIVHSITQTSQIWLDHQVSEERGELVTNWDGVDELFPPGLVDDLFAAYRRLLDLLAAEADDHAWSRPIAALRPLLLPPEQLARRKAVNATAAPLLESLAGPALLQEPFFARAAERPEAPAVLWAGGSLTYGELAGRARGLARHLRELGACPGQLVAVALDKGWEQAVAVLGVLASGAAWLPLDPGLPAERFRHLLARGEAVLAVTSSGLAGRLSWPSEVTVVTVDAAPPAGEDDLLPPVQQEDDLAYVIFTSGSTGQPKGVAIEHRAALNTVLDVNQRFGIGPEDRVLSLSSLSFDLSVWDLFGLWAAGGAVVLPGPEAARDPGAWTDLVAAGRVTVWNSVPALLGLWVESLEKHPGRRLDALRLALLSGDWISVGLPDRLRRLAPGVRVVSLGGATEASIWSILHEIGPVDPSWTSIPYGRPMANQTFHVLDESFAPRPDGVPGALWIGGLGVAQGYWHDEERTLASFVRHPVTEERLYRTGDLGLWQPDGEIELLGREDFQVKIQGYRVELGEIEAVLLDHPEVRAAVAVAGRDPAGERRLLAFVVATPGAQDLPARLRAHLEARLPRYMVPSSIQELPALPLTPTGKVDRGALPHLPPQPASPRPAPAFPAVSPLARRIAALVTEALAGSGIDAAGLDPEANLLELGATSLEIIRLANRLEEDLGVRPPVQSFYGAPTLATLVSFYEEKERPASAPAALASSPIFPLIVEPADREAFKLRRPGLRPLDERETLALPDGDPAARAPLYARRASHRLFAQQPIPLTGLAGLLSALRPASRESFKHLYPSAGGLYPVQVYIHSKGSRIDGLAAGTWYYHPAEHRLVPLTRDVELPPEIHDPFINRPVFDESAFSLFLVADLGAMAPIYGEPSLGYAALEAGYMGQLLMMLAADHNLGLCPIGQVDFDRIRGLFDLGPGHVLVHSLLGGSLDESRESAPQGLGEAWNVRIDGDTEEGEL
jgi:amino acid adenylation domain-containing protein